MCHPLCLLSSVCWISCELVSFSLSLESVRNLTDPLLLIQEHTHSNANLTLRMMKRLPFRSHTRGCEQVKRTYKHKHRLTHMNMGRVHTDALSNTLSSLPWVPDCVSRDEKKMTGMMRRRMRETVKTVTGYSFILTPGAAS